MSLLTSNEDMTVVPASASAPPSSPGADSHAVNPHRSPRTSVAATVSLVLAVLGLVAVATGVLAVVGAALGLLAVVFAISGRLATRHRHIVGRGNAIAGLVLGILAVAVGALALTGVLPWPDPETNQLTRLVEWLDAHAPWARPEL